MSTHNIFILYHIFCSWSFETASKRQQSVEEFETAYIALTVPSAWVSLKFAGIGIDWLGRLSQGVNLRLVNTPDNLPKAIRHEFPPPRCAISSFVLPSPEPPFT